MDSIDLFLHKSDDLFLAANSSDEFEILKSAGIIRQLFLEKGMPLFDVANKSLKHKLVFSIIDPIQLKPDILPSPSSWHIFDAIEPSLNLTGHSPLTCNRDKFFSLVLGNKDGVDYTIKDIISYVANKMGAIHKDTPKSKKEKMLEELGKKYIYTNISMVLYHLRSISRVILNALKPFKNRILNISRFEGQPGLSIQLYLKLFYQDSGKTLFILDIGESPDKNRISIYLDERGDLCFRVINSNGNCVFLRAATSQHAFFFETPCHLSFEIVTISNETLLLLDLSNWFFCKFLPKTEIDLSFSSGSPPSVIGSDLFGKEETNISMYDMRFYNHCLTFDEKLQINNYFNQTEYSNTIRFIGNQFLHSKNHPNFIRN